MKKTILFCLIAGIILTFTPSVMAKEQPGKPQDVIERSNGFPSGQHFNLNIHGKKYEYLCDPTPGGNSVFILEYTSDYPTPDAKSIIQYVSNKRSSSTQLEVLDPCDRLFRNPPDDDPVKVMLPHNIEVDGATISAGGFYVFGRILGKPNNGQNKVESNILLYPNVVTEACNDDPDTPDPDFGDYTSCDEVPLGLIVGENLYTAEPEYYERFKSGATKGKGKSKATDITPLFTYEGWAVDERLDISGDGIIDVNDIPVGAWTIIESFGFDPNLFDDDPTFGNSNDLIDLITEWLLFQAALQTPMAWYFTPTWIFNVADLVVTEQGLVNDGAKLLQLRFYPVATTEFTPR